LILRKRVRGHFELRTKNSIEERLRLGDSLRAFRRGPIAYRAFSTIYEPHVAVFLGGVVGRAAPFWPLFGVCCEAAPRRSGRCLALFGVVISRSGEFGLIGKNLTSANLTSNDVVVSSGRSGPGPISLRMMWSHREE